MIDPDHIGKKFLGKLEDLMSELSEEMLDEATRTRLETKIRDLLKKEGAAFNLTHLKAFYQGARLMMGMLGNDNHQMAMTMMIVTRGVIARKEKEVKDVLDKINDNGPANVQSDASDASAKEK